MALTPEEIASIAPAGGFTDEPPSYAPYAAMLGYPMPDATTAAPTPPPDVPPVPVPAPAPDTTQPEGPIVSPSQEIAQAPQPVQPTQAVPPTVQGPGVAPTTRSSAGTSAGFSTQGYSSAANAAIRQGPGSAIDRKVARDAAQTEQVYSPVTQEFGTAADVARAAAVSTAQIDAKKAEIAAEGSRAIAAAQNDFFQKEQAAGVQARANADAAQADYRTALAAYSAAHVDPSQLWEQAGTGGQMGMMFTAFTHDFLGARGVQTSGLDSINAAIKNNINAQLTALDQKKQVAAGFKELWDMQRSQSATDAEARQRLNGFYLASVKSGIEAKLATYDSPLAIAKGQAAIAALTKEQASNDLLVRQHIDQAANAKATNDVKQYGDELQASSARYAANAHIQAAQIEAGAKNKPVDPRADLIIDTTQSGGNEAKRRFLPGVSTELKTKIVEGTNKVWQTNDNVQALIDLQNQIRSTPPTDNGAIKKLLSEQQRVAETVRQLVKMGVVYDNSGKQINEQEIKLYDQLFARKDWFTNGDNLRQLATIAKMNNDKNSKMLSATSVALQPGDPAYGFRTGSDNTATAERTLTDIQAAPGSGRPQPTPVDDLEKQAQAPDAHTTVSPDSPQIARDWAAFRQDNPSSRPPSGPAKVDFVPGQGRVVVPGPDNPDKAFLALDQLASLALSGDQRAAAQIHTLAASKPQGDQDALLQAYASWEEARLSPPATPGDEGYKPGLSSLRK